MTCEETELELVTEATPSPKATEHLATCGRCRAFQQTSAQLLASAALPAPSAEEQAHLATLAPRLHREWSRLERRRSAARRVLGLAAAACVGAAVASAALLPVRQRQHVVVTDALEPTLAFPEPELSSSADTEDELEAFEVSWPSP